MAQLEPKAGFSLGRAVVLLRSIKDESGVQGLDAVSSILTLRREKTFGRSAGHTGNALSCKPGTKQGCLYRGMFLLWKRQRGQNQNRRSQITASNELDLVPLLSALPCPIWRLPGGKASSNFLAEWSGRRAERAGPSLHLCGKQRDRQQNRDFP